MKRKLAVVTAVLTFLTACNFLIYSRRLVADHILRVSHESCGAGTVGCNGSTKNMNDAIASSSITTAATDINFANSTDGGVAVALALNSNGNASRKSTTIDNDSKYKISLMNETSKEINQRLLTTKEAPGEFAKSTEPTEVASKSTVVPFTPSSSSSSKPLAVGEINDLCQESITPLLLILVTSAVDHQAQRNAIRETWGGLARKLPDVRLAFFVGRPKTGAVQNNVDVEYQTHGDLIQGDFLDTYRNLSMKSVAALRWTVTHCPRARFLMKADDDMFISIPNLVRYLRMAKPPRNLLFGRLVRGARPLRSTASKYYVPVSEYRENVYPDYLSGTAYVMSGDVVKKLYHVAQKIPLFVLEDIYITGICARRAGIPRRNHPGFVYYKRPVKGCAYVRVISGHDNTPADLRRIWKELQRSDLRC